MSAARDSETRKPVIAFCKSIVKCRLHIQINRHKPTLWCLKKEHLPDNSLLCITVETGSVYWRPRLHNLRREHLILKFLVTHAIWSLHPVEDTLKLPQFSFSEHISSRTSKTSWKLPTLSMLHHCHSLSWVSSRLQLADVRTCVILVR